jgi:hypothetical protein
MNDPVELGPYTLRRLMAAIIAGSPRTAGLGWKAGIDAADALLGATEPTDPRPAEPSLQDKTATMTWSRALVADLRRFLDLEEKLRQAEVRAEQAEKLLIEQDAKSETKPPVPETERAISAMVRPQAPTGAWEMCDFLEYAGLMAEYADSLEARVMALEKDRKDADIDHLKSCKRELMAFCSDLDPIRKNCHPLELGKRLSEVAMMRLQTLQEKLDQAKKLNSGWLRDNAPGGWIDNLRVEVSRLQTSLTGLEREELDQLRRQDSGPISAYYLLAQELGVGPGGSVVDTVHDKIRDAAALERSRILGILGARKILTSGDVQTTPRPYTFEEKRALIAP